MNSVTITPVFSWVVVGLLVALAVTMVVWSSKEGVRNPRRAWSLGGLRLGTVLVALVLLMQPKRRVDEVTVIKPQLAVLVDSSQSMEDKVDPNQPTRAERVKELLGSPSFAAARQTFDIRTFRFDGRMEEGVEANYQGNTSNLMGALVQLRERFQGQPVAAALLLSDGLDSSGVSVERGLQMPFPILTFELEKEFRAAEKAKRAWISALEAPGRIVVGTEAEVRATVAATGMSGATLSVELWRDGVKAGDTSVTFNEEEQTRMVVFPVSAAEPGVLQMEIRLPSAEADKESRKRAFVVEAVDPGKRILLLQNSFGFEFKFFRRAIAGDRNLQLQAFVRAGNGQLVAMGERPGSATGGRAPKLEFSQAGLSKYAVVVLADVSPEVLHQEDYEGLKAFVERGGGLVLMGGGSGIPSEAFARSVLGKLSPVQLPAPYREGKFGVKITDVGLRHPVLGPLFANVKEFPPLLTGNFAGGVSASAEVLVDFEEGGKRYPAVASARFGQGRVLAVMTDTVWHWRMGAKGWTSEKSPYDLFWTQVMEWMVPREQDKRGGAKLELSTEKTSYLMGERPQVRALLSTGVDSVKPPATLPLTVRTPDGKRFDYVMKEGGWKDAEGKAVSGYVVTVDPNVPGMFSAKAQWSNATLKVEDEARFAVSVPPTERTGRPIDRAMLKKIAEQTEGQFVAWDAREDWHKAVHFKEKQVATVRLIEVWNHPVLLALLLLMLSSDWFLRKRWNLP